MKCDEWRGVGVDVVCPGNICGGWDEKRRKTGRRMGEEWYIAYAGAWLGVQRCVDTAVLGLMRRRVVLSSRRCMFISIGWGGYIVRFCGGWCCFGDLLRCRLVRSTSGIRRSCNRGFFHRWWYYISFLGHCTLHFCLLSTLNSRLDARLIRRPSFSTIQRHTQQSAHTLLRFLFVPARHRDGFAPSACEPE
jgi:hypothetical protein